MGPRGRCASSTLPTRSSDVCTAGHLPMKSRFIDEIPPRLVEEIRPGGRLRRRRRPGAVAVDPGGDRPCQARPAVRHGKFGDGSRFALRGTGRPCARAGQFRGGGHEMARMELREPGSIVDLRDEQSRKLSGSDPAVSANSERHSIPTHEHPNSGRRPGGLFCGPAACTRRGQRSHRGRSQRRRAARTAGPSRHSHGTSVTQRTRKFWSAPVRTTPTSSSR